MGGWLEGVWRRGDFGVSVSVLEDTEVRSRFLSFCLLLGNYGGFKEGKDSVSWVSNNGLDFCVTSCYAFYGNDFIPHGPPNKFDDAFRLVWKVEVPFKIKAFGWILLLDRLPTKNLLVLRGIPFPVDNLKCIFCGVDVENRNHSFFGCGVVKNIWKEIAFWVGKVGYMEDECLSNFMDWHRFFCTQKLVDSKVDVVWLATTWTIWITRNEACFREEGWNVNDIVWSIKLFVWKWSFLRKNYTFQLFLLRV
ncbi:uncharacterized protein LOC131636394 [Vicia villosa]|uniref:uncharacterized protein LOC131636394 n=1 Tax=Vicia villosa TaxID=3911 RepID=UPI00273C8CF2|nr:uncharacterized protein LOC131636394 [Vicia villosa]